MATATRTRKTRSTKTAPAKARAAKATKPTTANDREKLAARVVRMRDRDGMAWTAVGEALGLTGSQLRNLYIRGAGATVGTRPKAAPATAAKKSPAKKGTAKKAAPKARETVGQRRARLGAESAASAKRAARKAA